MQRLNLFKPISFISRPAIRTQAHSLTANPALPFSSIQAAPQRESLRQREDRRRELAKLMESWQCTVGFEFHVQMNTKYKMFSTSLNTTSQEPNTHANFVDLGLPGMLPVFNEECLDQAIKASLALGGRILPKIKFDRKHYVYADLPQAYQITQKHNPIMKDGRLFFYDYKENENHILIERIQMEQEAAKSFKKDDKIMIDYNRAGMPLLEIVTTPKSTHPNDAKLIVREMQELLYTLGISQANIENAQLRVDVNLSVQGEKNESPRIDIKTVQSSKDVERAVEYEYRRHIELLSQGQIPLPEIRSYNQETGRTESLRVRSEEPDYRFFQDPDLPQITVTNAKISALHGILGEIPFDVKKRFCNQFGMDVQDVKNVFRNNWSIEMFTRLVWTLQIDPKLVYKWIYYYIFTDVENKNMNFQRVVEENFGHKKLVELITMVHEESLTNANAKEIMRSIIDGDVRMPSQIAEEQGFVGRPKNSEEIRNAVAATIENPENQEQIQKYVDGNPRAVNALVNKTMVLLKRNGDPILIKNLLQDAMKEKSRTYTSRSDPTEINE